MSGASKRTILIDWGTTNVRAFLVDSNGTVLERRESNKGIKFVAEGTFPAVYQDLVGDWENTAYTFMAGMVGSANGWQETPYTPLPASVSDLKKAVHPLSTMDNVYIAGGVSCRSDTGLYDVLRGEEMQAVGFLAAKKIPTKQGRRKHLLCLPGTHSKWLETNGDTLSSFTTVMSGDFFAAICSNTIMSLMLQTKQHFSEQAFVRGISLCSQAGGVMSRMFKVRSSYLFDQISPEHIESMISGVIIGSEIDEMRKLYDPISTVQVIGTDALIRKYGLALERFGVQFGLHDGEQLGLAGMIHLTEML